MPSIVTETFSSAEAGVTETFSSAEAGNGESNNITISRNSVRQNNDVILFNPDERDKYLGGVTMYIILKEVLLFLVYYDRVSVVRY